MAVVVTRKGREFVTFRLKGTPSAGSEPLNVGWGITAPNAFVGTAAATDVAPFDTGPEAFVVGTSSFVTTTTPNDTYQVIGTITASGTDAIVEAFLTDVTTKPVANTVAAGGVVGSAVSTTLNTGTSYSPGNGNYVQIRTEVMQVTAGSGSTALTVVRAQNGSAAISSIAAGDIVTLGNIPGVGTFGTTAGSLFVHADFAVINLASGDSIQFTFKVQVT